MVDALDLIRQHVEGGGDDDVAPVSPDDRAAFYRTEVTDPSADPMAAVSGNFVRPAEHIDWLAKDGVQVVTVATDEGVDQMLLHLDAALATEFPYMLGMDTETCPKPHLIKQYADIMAEYEAMHAKLKAFPTPKKCTKDQLAQREQAQLLYDEAHARYSEFMPIYKRAGLSVHDGQVRLLQLHVRPVAGQPDIVYVVDRWKISADAWQEIAAVMNSNRVHWFGHNVQFDIKMLGQHGMRPHPERVPNCSMLQAQALVSVSYMPKSLAERCGVVLGIEVDKRVRLSDWTKETLDQSQVYYAAGDPYLTTKLYYAQRAELLKNVSEDKTINFPNVYLLMRNSLPAVVEMETSGIGFDAAGHAKLAVDLKRKFHEGRQLILDGFRDLSPAGAPEIDNPGSSVQLNNWLDKVLADHQKTAWPKTDTGRFACGGDELKWVLAQDMLQSEIRPIFEQLSRWADAKKQFESFGDGYRQHARQITPDHWRLFGSIRTGGAETGRFSITDPALQTIPRGSEFRKLFISVPGWVLVGCDYGQIEVRIAAVLSGDPVLLDAIRNGLDIHSMTAYACFGMHPTVQNFMHQLAQRRPDVVGMTLSGLVRLPEVLDFFKKGAGKEFRQIAKIAIFGLIYGQGPNKLQWTLFAEGGLMLSVNECRAIQRNLLGLYKGLSDWMNRVRDQAEIDRKCWTPGGRQYDAGQRWYTKSVNTPCQGGAGEIMLNALRRFPNWGNLRAKLVLTVHDELITECREEDADRVKSIMEERMIEAALELFPTMPDYKLVEGVIGRNWMELKS